MRRVLIILLFLITVLSLHSQNKHITYIGEIPTFTKTKDSTNRVKTVEQLEKGYYHIIVLKNEKAISFIEEKNLSASDSLWKSYSHHEFLSLFDKQKSETKYITAFYNKKVKKAFISHPETAIWRKIDPNKKTETHGMV